MKRLLCSFVLLALALPWAGALAAPKTDAGGAPPLIDRELFFGDPLVSGAQLSPDGKYVSFIKQYREVRNIWVKTLDAPFDQARPVTADKRPIPGYFWSRDGQRLLYVQDKGGNENFHVYAVDPSATAETDTGVPPARDLTPLENVRAAIYAVPKGTPERDPRRAERPRCGVPRRLPHQPDHRRAHAADQEHGEDRRLRLRPGRSGAPRDPADPGRRRRAAPRGRRPADAAADLDLRGGCIARRLHAGQQGRLHDDQPGRRRRPVAPRPARPRHRRGKARRVATPSGRWTSAAPSSRPTPTS